MTIRRDLGRLNAHFDLAIIGGGISGVSVAREAASRGLSVILLDKADFGAGTSSATTKFIHGGIRYLEQREFAVVRESLRERRRLALAAPHLVRHTRFVLPVWSWSDPGALLLGAGVLTYDALSFDRNRQAPESLQIGHPRWLSARRTRVAVPWLLADGLRGAYVITDTMNLHPERLLLSLLRSATELGAVAINHVQVTGFLTEPEPDGHVRVVGLTLCDRLTEADHEVRATVVVNAAGPWMDVVLAKLGRSVDVRVARSKGVHLLTAPVGGVAVDDAVLARAPSGRHVIVSPWMGHSYIGPTDTPIADDPDAVVATSRDRDEILETVNACVDPQFPAVVPGDVLDADVGIRPLIAEEGRSSYESSRRHVLYDHATNGVECLWSIGGGKWTTGRSLGEDVVATLLATDALIHARGRGGSTRTTPVWGAFGWAVDPEPFLKRAAGMRPELPIEPDSRMHLARLYGTHHDDLLDLVAAEPSLGARVSTRVGCVDIGAQVVYAIVEEAAQTLSDILDRRLVIGTIGPVPENEIVAVATIAGPLLGWDPGRVSRAATLEHARRQRLRSLLFARPDQSDGR